MKKDDLSKMLLVAITVFLAYMVVTMVYDLGYRDGATWVMDEIREELQRLKR